VTHLRPGGAPNAQSDGGEHKAVVLEKIKKLPLQQGGNKGGERSRRDAKNKKRGGKGNTGETGPRTKVPQKKRETKGEK